MTFRKYICKSCFKLFAKNAELGLLTKCPHCNASNALSPRGEFKRRQGKRERRYGLSQEKMQ